jgi:hypothetical protein
VRIPAHLLETAKRYELQRWVNRKDFPADDWFQSVDECKAILTRHKPGESIEDGIYGDEPINDDAVALMLGTSLHENGALTTYVVSTAQGFTEDEWPNILKAAGYAVLQRYYLSVKKGEWPHG